MREQLRYLGIKRSWPYVVGSQLVFWFLSWALYGFANPLSNHLLPGTAPYSGDRVQEVWFFSWYAHALAHGLNPFVTGMVNAPFGANLMSNTSAPLLGFAGAPITWALGPLATYNFFLHAGLALSATSALFAARRVGFSRLPAFVIGLIFGFSSQQTVQAQVHVFLVFQIFTPWIFLLTYELVTRRSLPRRQGILLGLAIGGQYLISAERVVITLVTIVIGLIVALPFSCTAPTRPDWRSIGRNSLYAALSAMMVGGFLLYYQTAGPDRTTGLVHKWSASQVASLKSFVLPDSYYVGWPFAPRAATAGSAILEPGAYIGVALAAVCIIAVVVHRRSRTVWWLAITTLIVLSCALGAQSHSIPTPGWLMGHAPLLNNILPVRWMLVGWAGIALLVGVGLQYAVTNWKIHRIRCAALCLVTAAGLVAICPAHTIARGEASVPVWFESPAALHGLAHGTVLEYPYPSVVNNLGMLYQALSGMNYSLVGGEVIVGSGPDGESLGARPLTPHMVPDFFFQAEGLTPTQWFDLALVNDYAPSALPSLDVAIADTRKFMVKNRITDVVVTRVGDYKWVESYFTFVFGPPTGGEGTVTWWHFPKKVK